MELGVLPSKSKTDNSGCKQITSPTTLSGVATSASFPPSNHLSPFPPPCHAVTEGKMTARLAAVVMIATVCKTPSSRGDHVIIGNPKTARF